MIDITFPPQSTFYTPTAFLLSACLAMCGCSSARSVEAERSFRSESHLLCDTLAARSAHDAATYSLLRDTVIVRDTVRRSEMLRGDTLRLMTEKVRTVWRVRTVRDTVRLLRTDTVMFLQHSASEAVTEEVKEKPPAGGGSRDALTGFGMLLAATWVAGIFLYIKDKKKKKTSNE